MTAAGTDYGWSGCLIYPELGDRGPPHLSDSIHTACQLAQRSAHFNQQSDDFALVFLGLTRLGLARVNFERSHLATFRLFRRLDNQLQPPVFHQPQAVIRLDRQPDSASAFSGHNPARKMIEALQLVQTCLLTTRMVKIARSLSHFDELSEPVPQAMSR